MKKLKLGTSTLELSRIGLGTWAIGGGGWKFGWGSQDDKQSIAAINRAIELGVNWIDTAPLYGLGHAEEVIGRAIKPMKDKPLIATKFGIVWNDKRSMKHCLDKASIKTELEQSLKRLKIEAVGLYQMHWPMPVECLEEAWLCAVELVKEGKVRSLGVCNFGTSQLERIKNIYKPVSNQLPYSIMNRPIDKEIAPYCVKENIAVLAYGVLEKGLLTGEFTKERIEKLPMDDHRKRDSAFIEPKLSKNLALASELKSEALKAGVSPAKLAIEKVLKNSSVCAAIVGARSPKQIENNLGMLT
jgi:aryl-alcohol dehydrogenase-like predicted oxidoreductase